MREDLRRARRFLRRLEPRDPAAPIPPPLPPGAVMLVPDRGELFVRHQPEPRGGIPVLLLHGWTATADLNWFAVYEALEGHRPYVALDHRGHGRGLRTEQPFTLEDCADDAAALLELLGHRQVVVVGYSMGGPIALLLADRHPDLVAGLVLGATALEWRSSWYERLVWRFLALFELGLRSSSSRGIVERLIRDAIEQNPELADLRAWLLAETRRGDPQAIGEAGRALSTYDARPFAARLDMPAVVLQTIRDRTVRPRKQAQLARALQAPLVRIGGDHDAPLVLAREFAACVIECLDRLSHAVGDRRTA